MKIIAIVEIVDNRVIGLQLYETKETAHQAADQMVSENTDLSAGERAHLFESERSCQSGDWSIHLIEVACPHCDKVIKALGCCVEALRGMPEVGDEYEETYHVTALEAIVQAAEAAGRDPGSWSGSV